MSTAVSGGSAAGLGGGAVDRGVQADVVARPRGDGHGHRRALGAAEVGEAEVTALTSGGGADEHPQEQDQRPLAHNLLRGLGYKPGHTLAEILARRPRSGPAARRSGAFQEGADGGLAGFA